jgi:hypothetical protein
MCDGYDIVAWHATGDRVTILPDGWRRHASATAQLFEHRATKAELHRTRVFNSCAFRIEASIQKMTLPICSLILKGSRAATLVSGPKRYNRASLRQHKIRTCRQLSRKPILPSIAASANLIKLSSAPLDSAVLSSTQPHALQSSIS